MIIPFICLGYFAAQQIKQNSIKSKKINNDLLFNEYRKTSNLLIHKLQKERMQGKLTQSKKNKSDYIKFHTATPLM